MHQHDYWLLPEGIEEVLPDSAEALERLRRALLDLFQTWGYRLVIPPMVDFLDTLLTGTGHDLDLQTFKLTDQLSGRLMGIRADMTPQMARIDAHHHRRHNTPARLCYLGTVLRTRSPNLEGSRSPMQVGAELYGHRGIESDLEVLGLMLETLALAGIEEVHLDLGHVGVYRALVRQANLDRYQETELFSVLQRKAHAELQALLDSYRLSGEIQAMLLALSDLNGEANAVLTRARRLLGKAGDIVAQALAELERVEQHVRATAPSLPIHVDLAELRGYHYHTGIVFAALTPGQGREIARGGRYDDIGQLFGRARPATGFSADLKTLMRLGTRPLKPVQDEPEAIFAPHIADADLDDCVRNLRSTGRIVIRELPTADDTSATNMATCTHQLQKLDQRWQVVPLTDH